jgi:ATP-dependent DNA helicase RecQ
MRRQPQSEEELMLERAFVLQGIIKAQKQALAKQEKEYKDIIARIKATGKNRYGYFQVNEKVSKRRIIISDKFFKLWPQQFLRLAKVTLKDASAVIPEEELNASGIFEEKPQVLYEVVRLDYAKKEGLV